ncbi:phenylacetate--CoA ligase family protein [Thalassotalea litorea]|nr:phenylacetate--CoA ligase family protein [Thalassotalea litorea]
MSILNEQVTNNNHIVEMDIYSTLFKSILFPGYERIKGRRTSSLLTEAEDRLQWPLEKIEQYQLTSLRNLLHYCDQHVPYYQRQWKALDFNPKDLTSVAQLAQLPPLTKQDIQENYDLLVPQEKRASNYKKSTGGSTGRPFHFELDKGSYETRQAMMWRGYGWGGVTIGTRTWYLWGVELGSQSWKAKFKDDLFHRFYHRKMANSFALSKDNFHQYIEEINDYRPKAIVAYVAPLYSLAKYINERGIQLHQPQVILTGAEALLEYQRQEIQKAFRCQVLNTYGCREFMLIGAECPQQNGLHLNIDQLVVETIDEQRQTVKNQVGDILITDLFNYGMPLVRYVNGDQGVISERRCECHNPLPMLESVNGRKLDIIRSPEGRILPGEFFPHLLKDFRGIERFQVRQKSLSSLDIFIVANEQYDSATQATINGHIQQAMGNQLDVVFHQVSDIPLTSTGKHRVTISEL